MDHAISPMSVTEIRVLGPGRGFIFHAEEVFADIRPELFEDVGSGGDNGLCGEIFGGFAEAAFGGGVVEVRERGFRGIAANLGNVELVGAAVVLADEGAAEGVAGALKEAVLAEGVVARILVGESGENSFGEALTKTPGISSLVRASVL